MKARVPKEGTVAAVIASYKANERSTAKMMAFKNPTPQTQKDYSKFP